MDDSFPLQLIILLILVLCSGFFSATETAFTCLNRARLKSLANGGDAQAEKILRLLEEYDKLISTILIGNNVVNIVASALATVAFVKLLGDGGVTVATVVTTVLVLLIGEVAPKSIARARSEKIAFAFYPVITFIVRVFTPFNFLMGCWQKLVSGMFGAEDDPAVTEEEIMTMVDEAESDGEIDAHESELIHSAIEFADLTAEDILTPRVDMATINITATDAQIAEAFVRSGYSRLPVCGESVDDIVGVLHEKDFYQHRGEPLKKLMSTPVCVIPSARLSVLLKLLQKQKAHMAVVLDEYGGVLGIVTLEDILEELVGEIWDEHDEVVEEISKAGEGHWRVLGSAPLDDFLKETGIRREYESVTVAGWVQEEIGKLPAEGDEFDCADLHVTVEKVRKHHVESILVHRRKGEEEQE